MFYEISAKQLDMATLHLRVFYMGRDSGSGRMVWTVYIYIVCTLCENKSAEKNNFTNNRA